MANNKQVGSWYEEQAALFLEDNKIHIVERNFRCRQGEIDLIALDKKCLVFVEVKFRNTKAAGLAAEAVSIRKQQKISRVADFYLYTHPEWEEHLMRFDVIAIDGEQISWYQNAFDYIGR